MDSSRIGELLLPFLNGTKPDVSLTAGQLSDISTYIDLLLRWNARVNLTAIREPEEIVTRHFGESLFAARHILGEVDPEDKIDRLIDLGSGAGFPGLPIKIWAPQLAVTLIESNHKKVAFLREVIRALKMSNVDVFDGRAERFPAAANANTAVVMRAVENFRAALASAVTLAGDRGRVALLIGKDQIEVAGESGSRVQWNSAVDVPLSQSRVLLTGKVTPYSTSN